MRITVYRQLLDLRAARIRQAQKFGTLIQSFPGSIIHSLRENLQVPCLINLKENGITAGHDKAKVRQQGLVGSCKTGWIRLVERDKRRKRMPPQMIDAVQW